MLGDYDFHKSAYMQKFANSRVRECSIWLSASAAVALTVGSVLMSFLLSAAESAGHDNDQ